MLHSTMTLFQTILIAVIEGFTEFLPVSSTAHILIVEKFLGVSYNEFIELFTIVIQAATVPVMLYFSYKNLKHLKKLALPLIVSLLPNIVVGIFIFAKFDTLLTSALIPYTLILGGVGFILVEYLITRKKLVLKKNLTDITLRDAFLIGAFQLLAIIPGVSRAGSVFLIMLLLGYKRKDTVIYSFLLGVPTILGASFLKLVKYPIFTLTTTQLLNLVLGSLIALITSFIVAKALLEYLKDKKWYIFGWYRIALGVMLRVL